MELLPPEFVLLAHVMLPSIETLESHSSNWSILFCFLLLNLGTGDFLSPPSTWETQKRIKVLDLCSHFGGIIMHQLMNFIYGKEAYFIVDNYLSRPIPGSLRHFQNLIRICLKTLTYRIIFN